MCSECIPKGVLASVFAGVSLTLIVSAAGWQWANPPLSVDWMSTAKSFLKYAVGFFFLGLAKWQMHEGMQAHTAAGKKKK
ncbi:MAG: hypothetical protein J4469_04435 [Candidatus Aenigmarchaeota archaeon]|nr:hypothetical protein [Candidatus Aenigmarchaeota archaeon]